MGCPILRPPGRELAPRIIESLLTAQVLGMDPSKQHKNPKRE
jgi:hypothetical protein